MPITNYTNLMRPASYDLIDQAYKRSIVNSQASPTMGSPNSPAVGGPGASQPQSPDLFNRDQPGPVQQTPDAPYIQQGGMGQQGQPQGGGDQGGGGNSAILTMLASLLGGGQQGHSNYKPQGTTMGQRMQDSWTNQPPPWMALQGQLGGQPGQQPPELSAIFEPGNYTFGNGAFQTPMLNQGVRQQALDFILRNLAGSMRGSA